MLIKYLALPIKRLTYQHTMTVTIKEQSQLLVPSKLQRRAGFKLGDRLEFKVSQGIITISAKPAPAENEYTPEQRRQIDASLAKADEDVKAGRVHGPFSLTEAKSFLRAELKARGKKTKQLP